MSPFLRIPKVHGRARQVGPWCTGAAHRALRAATGLLLACMALAAAVGDERLTDSGRLKFSPVFLPDGQALLFVELVDPTLYQIRKLSLQDRSTVALHGEANTSEFEPAVSFDGRAYAYLKTRGVLSISLVVQSLQGELLAELPPAEGFAGYRGPALAPNAAQVAFSFAEAGRQQIYLARVGDSARTALTDSRGINNWPHFSPDGRQIVFGSSRDGNFEIYIMNSDGSRPRRLTESPGQDIRPKFSPDGSRIAFTSHRDGNAEIYVMNADGSDQLRLTENADRDDYADWHPDGRRIVLVSERGGRHDLYLIEAAGDRSSRTRPSAGGALAP